MPRARAIRAVAAALFALVAGWTSVAVSVASFARVSNPALSERIAPFDAVAKGERAFALFSANPRATAEARRLAVEALARDATAVSAVRTIGVIYEARGDQQGAARAFHYSERLSRRDFPTQLWLIEERVRQNDVAGALRHFDRALRTSNLAPPVLLPILVSATEDKLLVEPIARLLLAKPHWRTQYLSLLVWTATSADNAAALVQRVQDPEAMGVMFDRAVREGRFDLAAAILRQAVGSSPRSSAFAEALHEPLPLGARWLFPEEPFGGELLGPTNGERVVAFEGHESGSEGPIATRLFALPPGTYTVALAAETLHGGNVELGASCLPRVPTRLGALKGAGRIAAVLEVPSSTCPLQQIVLQGKPSSPDGTLSGRLSELTIKVAR